MILSSSVLSTKVLGKFRLDDFEMSNSLLVFLTIQVTNVSNFDEIWPKCSMGIESIGR